jgi:hypothetical protein
MKRAFDDVHLGFIRHDYARDVSFPSTSPKQPRVQANMSLPERFRWPFAYIAGVGRDARLDWLRGYCLFMMIVDHVGTVAGNVTGSSWLYVLTGGTRYYATAAEAFYLISGVTLGLISSRESARDSTRRIYTRAFHLYRTALMLSLTFGAVALWTNWLYFGRWSFESSGIASYVFRVLTLRAETGGAGILVLYVLFMIVTPGALWLFRKNLAWVVLLASILLYSSSQVVPQLRNQPFAVYFDVLPWQILFFGGLALGFHRAALVRFFSSLLRIRTVLEVAVVAFAFVFLVVHATEYRFWPSLPALLVPMEELPFVRLVLAMLSMLAAYILLSWFWNPLRAALGWLLEPLGRASLWSFTMHFYVILALWNLPIFQTVNVWFWQVIAVALVWLSLRVRDALVRWQTPKSRVTSPVSS